MSIVEAVCEQIRGSSNFIADYSAIAHQSILNNVGLEHAIFLDEEAVRRLVQSATIFAQSNDPEWRQIAYRISIGALAYAQELEGLEEAVRLILARLGNHPAIRFAFSDAPEPKTLPAQIFFEMVGRKIDNTVNVGGSSTVLTDMQKTVWDALLSGNSVALSAPTSAGKSFVFFTYINQTKLTHPDSNIVYLVPSRALISQVADDLRSSEMESSFDVTTVPLAVTATDKGTPIYVLTPERLQVLFYLAPDLVFNLAIVDEAHLISEGSRGVVLHSVLEELERRKSDIQFLFSSPQVRNPEMFGAVIGRSNVETIATKDVSVAQNIILLKGDLADSRRIHVKLWDSGNEVQLTEIDATIPVYDSRSRLIYLSWRLGAGSQNLVYATGPASCEDIALKLKDLINDPDVSPEIRQASPSEEVQQARTALSRFAKEAVHSTYVLADTVRDGIGFHYGRIPALLRNAIEDSFSAGHLNYIICTSTLLQGVNLPARNIFMENPHKGYEHPIEPVDFWNLAGRAGRLGKDFQGNVFLVDYDQWEVEPLSGPKDEPVRSSLEKTLLMSSAEFLEYVVSSDEPSGEAPVFESTFSKLLRDHRRGHLDGTLDRIPTLQTDIKTKIKQAIESADAQISIQVDTLDASPQISGYRQQELYDYMCDKIEEKGPEYLIPLHPSGNWKQVLDKLYPIFARVHRYIELRSGNHHRYWAPLALRWMRGDPLPMIIDAAISYHKTQNKNRSNRTVIREVLDAVENDLRFKYVNLLACYTAVLRQSLQDKGFEKYAQNIPALTLFLELGAASTTMIHLMSLGLSRHTANLIAQQSINRDMNLEGVKGLLQRIDPRAAGFSPFLENELNRVRSSL
jgi:replicative superfamily II helicase